MLEVGLVGFFYLLFGITMYIYIYTHTHAQKQRLTQTRFEQVMDYKEQFESLKLPIDDSNGQKCDFIFIF